MTATKFTHIAYNLATGEVLMSTRSNSLRRRIARNKAWDRANGYYAKSEWVFAHGEDCESKARVKVQSLLAKRGGAR
jgi:hypothetical protein